MGRSEGRHRSAGASGPRRSETRSRARPSPTPLPPRGRSRTRAEPRALSSRAQRLYDNGVKCRECNVAIKPEDVLFKDLYNVHDRCGRRSAQFSYHINKDEDVLLLGFNYVF